MPYIIRYAKLDFPVEHHQVQQEVNALVRQDWLPHYNTLGYQGDWTVLTLRAPGGNSSLPFADLTGEAGFMDTGMMGHCPSIKKLVDALQCEKMSVRLLNLKSGSFIKAHRDIELAFEKGEARLHFPVITNPGVEFYQDGELVTMQPGECWYINANLTHSVNNNGDTDRIHLVIDCKVNDWLKEVFDRSEKSVKKDTADRNMQLQLIHQLRAHQTEASDALADQLEKELSDPY